MVLRRRLFFFGVFVLLAACRPVSRVEQTDGPRIDPEVKRTAQEYRVGEDSADIRLLVYKAGALAALGHNHVISAPKTTGVIYRHPDLQQSAFELSLRVSDLVIDDPELRAEEGEDFASRPTDSDIEGTRRNMLGERLLDGDNFPTISVVGTGLVEGRDDYRATLWFTIKGRPYSKEVPLTITLGQNEIVVAGEFELTHQELGLTPFSVMLGALQVADTMGVRVNLKANVVIP